MKHSETVLLCEKQLVQIAQLQEIKVFELQYFEPGVHICYRKWSIFTLRHSTDGISG